MRRPVLLLSLAVTATVAAAPSSSATTRSCDEVPGLVSVGDADGEAAVILVHGWVSSADIWSTTVDQGVNRFVEPTGRPTSSFIDDLAGIDAWTLDYRETAGRWVTSDDAAGPRLVAAVECLHERYGVPVGIVGHSMGGLAARYATDLAPDRVAGAVTIGTPHSGSDIAAVGGYLLGAIDTLTGDDPEGLIAGASREFIELVRFCGRATTESIDACGDLPTVFAAADGEAGRALRTGSSELEALPAWPPDVPTMSIAGDIVFRYEYRDLFGRRRGEEFLSIADGVVDTGSATGLGDTVVGFECAYVGSADPLTYLPEGWNLTYDPSNQRGLPAVFSSPCLHTKLTSTLDVVNRTMGFLGDVVTPSTFDVRNFDLPTGVCFDDASAVTVVDGLGDGTSQDTTFAVYVPPETPVLRQDVTGDGVPDVVFAFTCEGLFGGNNFFQLIAVFSPDGPDAALLATVPPSGAGVRGLELVDGRLRSTEVVYLEGDARCCPTGSGYSEYVWTDEGLVLTDASP